VLTNWLLLLLVLPALRLLHHRPPSPERVSPMPPRSVQSNGVQNSDLVRICVKAESEDDQEFDWHTCLCLNQQVRVVANAWAAAYGVPVGAVGLDEQQSGRELDLSMTPMDYEWAPGSSVSLKAYPTEENLMEVEVVAAAEPEPTPDAPEAASRAAPRAASKAATKPAAKKEGRHPLSRHRRTGGLSRGSSVQPKQRPMQQQQQQQQQQQTQQQVFARPAGRGDATPDDDAPGKVAPVVWDQTNPKRAGSCAFDRYERYKRAKTVGEALSLGAAPGDISFDFKKGYLKHS